MDVFNGDLESVEASCLGRLDLGGEVTGEILVNNTVRSSKEGKDV